MSQRVYTQCTAFRKDVSGPAAQIAKGNTMMARLLLSALAVTALASADARAQWRGRRRPYQRPATRPAVDHVKDLFDTYTQGRERERFFAAAGVDGNLTAKEYQAASGKKDGFVRSYDSWEAAAACDADKDGRLSWAEAEKYREGVRQSVLKLFDKNRDHKLTGPERDEANRHLSRKLRAPGTGRTWGGGASPRQYDTNGDGRIDENERAAMREAGRQRAEEARRRWELQQSDADKDGTLSDQERAAMEKAQAEQRAAAEQRRKEMLDKYDANRNGQIDGDENRAMYQDMRDRRAKERLDRWDADKNGLLDEKELAAEREHYRAEVRRRVEQYMIRRHDKDGDGKLNEQEQAAADTERRQWEQMRRQGRQLMREWQRRLDRDGDGQVSDEERRVGAERLQAEVRRRQKEMDTDGDGRVSREEGFAYLQKLTAKYDADGDGQLNADERREMIRREFRSMMGGLGRGGRGRRGRGGRGRGGRPQAPGDGNAAGETAPVIIRTAP